MKVYEIKAKRVYAGPGSVAYVAEACVEDGTGGVTYVTAQEYDGTELTVSKESLYAFLAENAGEPAETFTEEYTEWSDAKTSGYAEVFDKLKKVVKMIGGC